MGIERWHDEAIEYTDIDKVKHALLGRKVTNVSSAGEEYERVISYTLDNGTVLKAHATDGGCGCDNGCFTVENPDDVRGATILNVELEEVAKPEYPYDLEKGVVEPGSIHDGEATIRVFVYTELGKHTLIESEGGDNGYYGWGFWLSVEPLEGGQ